MIFNKIKELKEKGLIVGITFSQFDLLHAGHIAMLSEAKNHCDYLIAGLQNNAQWDRPEKNEPIQSIVERQISLSAVTEYVNSFSLSNLGFIIRPRPINQNVLLPQDVLNKAIMAAVQDSSKAGGVTGGVTRQQTVDAVRKFLGTKKFSSQIAEKKDEVGTKKKVRKKENN